MATVKFDPEAEAVYIRLNDRKVEYTEHLVDDEVLVDRDADDDVVGIEILYVTKIETEQ